MAAAVFVEAAQQLAGREGAGAFRGGEDVGGIHRHKRQDGVQVLIGHYSVHNDEGGKLAAGYTALQLGEVVPQGVGVVADIRHHVGLGTQALPPAAEVHVAGGVDDAFLHGVGVLQAREGLPQEVRRQQHGAKVFLLHIGPQVHFLEDSGAAVPKAGALLVGKMEGAEHVRLFLEDGGGFGLPLPHYDGHAGLEDAGFFGGNFR